MASSQILFLIVAFGLVAAASAQTSYLCDASGCTEEGSVNAFDISTASASISAPRCKGTCPDPTTCSQGIGSGGFGCTDGESAEGCLSRARVACAAVIPSSTPGWNCRVLIDYGALGSTDNSLEWIVSACTGGGCTTPGGCGDPHFTSFNGINYDFMGYPGAVFNILSASAYQLNALFSGAPNGNTFMTEIGMKYLNKYNVAIKATDYGKLKATLNGHELQHTLEWEGVQLQEGVTIERMSSAFMGPKWLSGETVRLSTPEVSILVYSPTLEHIGDIPEVHLDFMVQIRDQEALGPMHGILGQTYNWSEAGVEASSMGDTKPTTTEAALEGSADDYVVPTLLGEEFRFNKFTGALASSKAAKTIVRARRALLNVFAH